jgi:hypothetical protein
MEPTSEYLKFGLTRETWIALCSLILTGPLSKSDQQTLQPAYDCLTQRGYAATIELPSQGVIVESMAATPAGAQLFCQCLGVSTVKEGIVHLQARNVLHRASHS